MKNNIIKSRKGDVSITILVIGVFAVCSLAVISFMIFKAQNNNSSVNMEIFENLSSAVEKYYFYLNSGLSPDVAATNVGGQIQNGQLVLNSILKNGNDILVSIKYTVIK
jgi:hypothetical protein